MKIEHKLSKYLNIYKNKFIKILLFLSKIKNLTLLTDYSFYNISDWNILAFFIFHSYDCFKVYEFTINNNNNTLSDLYTNRFQFFSNIIKFMK